MRSQEVILALAFVLVAILVAGCTNAGSLPESRMTPTAPLIPASGSPIPSEKLVAFVEKTYEYAHEHGQEAALREFNNQTGRFVEGELYPYEPDLVGTNRLNWTDIRGLPVFRVGEFTASSGGGFMRASKHKKESRITGHLKRMLLREQ